MRVSRSQAAENRQTVINVASRLFRERGFDGIGLKDLMKGAGLTQGAFYKQFASKDDLAAQRSEEHTSELQSQSNLVCRLLLEKKKINQNNLVINNYSDVTLHHYIIRPSV